MPTLPSSLARNHANWLRLRTLVQLRYVAIAGQVVAVLTASMVFSVDIRWVAVGGIIGFWALINSGLATVLPVDYRFTEMQALILLFIDLAEISALLAVTGGMGNPFAILLIVPVIIAATAFSRRALLGLIAAAAVFALILRHDALPLMRYGLPLEMPQLFQSGNLVAVLVTLVFLSFFIRRISYEALAMSRALAATELALQREQRLASLGGLTAAYAHELGTPLATISIASQELRERLEDSEYFDDADLIYEQVRRCRKILVNMGELGKDDVQIRHIPLVTLVEDAARPHFGRDKDIDILVNGQDEHLQDMPTVARSPAVLHGLRNLIENAVDHANDAVGIMIDYDDTHVTIRIEDDGKGFPSDIIDRVGDPFLRSRRRRRGEKGMGLGLFISRTLLERSGAVLKFANLPPDCGGGAVVTAKWALEKLVIPDTEHKQGTANPYQDNAA